MCFLISWQIPWLVSRPLDFIKKQFGLQTASKLMAYCQDGHHDFIYDDTHSFGHIYFATGINNRKTRTSRNSATQLPSVNREAKPDIILLIKEWVKKHKPRTIPLRPDRAREKIMKKADWNLYINEQIETDL